MKIPIRTIIMPMTAIHVQSINDQNHHYLKRNKYYKRGKNKLIRKKSTMKGLELLNELTMPKQQAIALIKALTSSTKHVISGCLQYRERLTAMTVGILEIIKLQELEAVPNMFEGDRKPQVLLVAPRRHMAIEAREMFLAVGQFYRINCDILIGGMPSYSNFIRRLRDGIDIICGTPGKIADMVDRRVLTRNKLCNLVAVVFDGAEEIFSSHSMRRQMSLVGRAFPEYGLRVLWLNSVFNPHTAQEAISTIRKLDTSINSCANERKKIHIVNSYCETEDIRAMTHIVKHVRDDRRRTKVAALQQMVRYFAGDDILIFFNQKKTMRNTFEIFLTENDNCIRSRPRSMFYCIDGDCCNQERRDIMHNFAESGGIVFTTDLLNGGGYENPKVNVIINAEVPRFHPITKYIQRAAVSNCKYVFTIVNTWRFSNDENLICGIRSKIKIAFKSYHCFSQQRRRHKSVRGQSILDDGGHRYRRSQEF
eukprot:909709_1